MIWSIVIGGLVWLILDQAISFEFRRLRRRLEISKEEEDASS